MKTSAELQKLCDSGLQFTVQPDGDRGYIVRHGNYLHEPGNSVVVPTFEDAVAWLRDKVGTGRHEVAVGRPGRDQTISGM